LEKLILARLQRLKISPEQCSDDLVHLTAEQQHYLSRVLRLNVGDRFIALLHSNWWLAELQPNQTARLLETLEIQTELQQPIVLCAALMKGQGFEEVVRAATELGASQIVPLLSHRTVVNPSDQKLERWRRIAAEAAEQCCRQVVPQVLAPMPFEAAIVPSSPLLASDNASAPFSRFLCVTHSDAPNLLDALASLPKLGILIMIGPEGGWTSTEQDLAIAQGFMPVSLGQRVLRSITASIAVVSVLSVYLSASEIGDRASQTS
jgi:16S rRNA (uracil1498-N3)-methyltransferase